MSRAIHALGGEPPVVYAAEELARCLDAMDGRRSTVEGSPRYEPRAGGLWVGTADRFAAAGSPLARAAADAVRVADARFDDAVLVEVEGGSGAIAGSNPRSALLGAYRYLHELGCRWVRPGPDGEYLPRIDPARRTVRLAERASYRHRGICIEGAVGWEQLRNMIAWMPRVGLNAYFIQFREGFTFFDRWYSRLGSPAAAPGSFGVPRARELVARAEGEIVKRGLLHHAVGHGWTCEPFGVPALGWDERVTEVADDVRPMLAEVNGRREWWGGIPLNTNLCWSNPEARRTVARAVADYAVSHPGVDVIHLWLADGSNNSCECPDCGRIRPADLYVMLLNEVDDLLGARGSPTRIVFLAYFDLLWPPERERIANPDRFILMFAPITRSYSRSFMTGAAAAPRAPAVALPPFVRNRLTFPRGVEENLAFLAAWREGFDGDGFDFDYHLMWDHFNDPGAAMVARILHDDVVGLAETGLNGLVSCQTQRVCLPTGLAMTIMGWTLWDRTRDYHRMAADYYEAAFGQDGPAAREYLERLTELFDPPRLRGERPDRESAAAGALEMVPALVAGIRPVIARNRAHPDPCRAASWRYLEEHAAIVLGLAEALALRARGAAAEAKAAWGRTRQEAWRREKTLSPVFDTWVFTQVMDQKLSAGS